MIPYALWTGCYTLLAYVMNWNDEIRMINDKMISNFLSISSHLSFCFLFFLFYQINFNGFPSFTNKKNTFKCLGIPDKINHVNREWSNFTFVSILHLLKDYSFFFLSFFFRLGFRVLSIPSAIFSSNKLITINPYTFVELTDIIIEIQLWSNILLKTIQH